MNEKQHRLATWAARIAVLVVFAANLECAVQFIVWPADSAAAYELSGAPGSVAVVGLAVAFLMWNATYPLVILHPGRNLKLFAIVLIQQLIGLIGESLILTGIPVVHDMLTLGIMRFIIFDGLGLVLMGVAFIALMMLRSRDRAAAAEAERRAELARKQQAKRKRR